MIFSRFWRGFRPRVPAATTTAAGTTLVPEQEFCFPLPGHVRIALLEGGFRADRNMREFTQNDLVWLFSYAPEALVAPLDPILSLADQRIRGLFELPSLDTAIVVLTSLEDSPLANHHRDLLWKAFGVPIFEQLRAGDGSIIARECEVHDGLHIDKDARGGFPGEIVTGTCECGAETPRLRGLARTHDKASIAAA